MKVRISLLLTSVLILALGFSEVTARQRASYSGIVVFGTSLSDSGNAFALRGGVATPHDYMLDPLLVPSAPYARGGHHFSDGATWIEQLARSWGLAGSARPAFASNSVKATNYAVGAARAREDGRNVNLGYQVQTFLADHGPVVPSDALYVIEMGSNDIRDAIVAFQTGGFPAAQLVLQQAIEAIAINIQVLYGAGARHFLVWLPPNVALTPALRTLAQSNPAITQLGTLLTQSFNTALSGVVAQLSAAFPDATFTLLDAYELLNEIVAAPADFGLTNVDSACVMPNVAPFFCQAPDDYLFWDGIHPSRAGHAITAAAAASLFAR